MVGSITSTTMMPQRNHEASSYILTQSQQEIISTTLSKYDPDRLTPEDAMAIVETFQEAGIKPSLALSQTMSSQGFSAQNVGELAGVNNTQNLEQMPLPPMQRVQEENSVFSQLEQLLNFDNSDDNSSSDPLNQILEYTYRIINLNEESKAEVMDLFDKFLDQSSEYSLDEKSNILKNSLSQILSDPDNYNRVSFYA